MQRPICVPLTLTHKHHDGSSNTYIRHEELGRGGFAAVYRVTEQSSGKDYALKAISRDRVSKPKSLEKLKSEISIQKSLDHPNILKSFDSFEDSNNYYQNHPNEIPTLQPTTYKYDYDSPFLAPLETPNTEIDYVIHSKDLCCYNKKTQKPNLLSEAQFVALAFSISCLNKSKFNCVN